MKEINTPSVFVNVSSCTLNFTNGKSVLINGEGKDRFLVVNVTACETDKSDFNESVLKYFKSAKTLSELAKKCGFSCTKTFTRHFVKFYNETPKQWILNMKQQEMINYLTETDYSFERISQLLDFNTISHFNNFCKNRTGYTPKEIRNSVTA